MASDNTVHHAKQRLRAALTKGLKRDTPVLELFAGEGKMYDAVWSDFTTGLTMDRDIEKVRRAAATRANGWASYRTQDSGRAVAAGMFEWMPFGIVDIDAYGTPWKFLRDYLESDRARPREVLAFLTDGWSLRPIGVDRSLFPKHEGQLTVPMVRDAVRNALPRWGSKNGLDVEIVKTVKPRAARNGKMLLHVVRVTRR